MLLLLLPGWRTLRVVLGHVLLALQRSSSWGRQGSCTATAESLRVCAGALRCSLRVCAGVWPCALRVCAGEPRCPLPVAFLTQLLCECVADADHLCLVDIQPPNRLPAVHNLLGKDLQEIHWVTGQEWGGRLLVKQCVCRWPGNTGHTPPSRQAGCTAQLCCWPDLAGGHVVALGGILDGLFNLFGLKLDVCSSMTASTAQRHTFCLPCCCLPRTCSW